MSCFLGVDPGLKGGVAVISEFAGEAIPMPVSGGEVDVDRLRAFVASWGWVNLAVVEKVHAMPGNGVSSMFSFGMGYGMVRATLALLGVSVRLVSPPEWKKSVLRGLPHDKEGAIRFCKSRFPKISLVPKGCRTTHDGIADALCIAEYARLSFGGFPAQHTTNPMD